MPSLVSHCYSYKSACGVQFTRIHEGAVKRTAEGPKNSSIRDERRRTDLRVANDDASMPPSQSHKGGSCSVGKLKAKAHLSSTRVRSNMVTVDEEFVLNIKGPRQCGIIGL